MAKYSIEKSTLTAIADSIRKKTDSTDPIGTSDMPSAIESIIDADTSDATAYAEHLLAGKTAYARGAKITGTIETVEQAAPSLSAAGGVITAAVEQHTGYVSGGTKTATISDENLIPENIVSGKTVFGVAGSYADGGTDTSDATATAADILSGKTAYVNGEKITGEIQAATQATPSITVSDEGLITASATQSAGYVSAGTKSATKQLTVQGAQTITPGTADKTIASGRYLTGTQTIQGDSNLTAANIKSGVSIFGVAGTYEGSPATYTVTAAFNGVRATITIVSTAIGDLVASVTFASDLNITIPSYTEYTQLSGSDTSLGGYSSNIISPAFALEINNSVSESGYTLYHFPTWAEIEISSSAIYLKAYRGDYDDFAERSSDAYVTLSGTYSFVSKGE